MPVAVVGGAHDQLCALSRRGKHRCVPVLRQLCLTLCRAVADQSHRAQDRLPGLVRGQRLQTLLTGQLDVHTEPVGQQSQLMHQLRRRTGDSFGVDVTVETVVLLSKGEVDSKKIRVEFSLEDMDMSEFQDGATYTQIKDYVLEHSGLKVSNLYISQIKRKCGIEVGKNYNLPKSEDSRQPLCPPEKEKAIREAFKYFGMI